MADKSTMKMMDANEATAHVAHRLNEVPPHKTTADAAISSMEPSAFSTVNALKTP